MATYSHSRVSAFEQCPFKYKLNYVDKLDVEVSQTIEAFMGNLVHQTLEKMYKDRKFKKRVSKATLIKFYRDLWKKEYSKDILVVKEGLTSENYRKMGEKYISDYYNSHKKDDMTIIGLETQDRMTLPDGNQWHIRMDKLGFKGDSYFVCDYKTNFWMKTQEEADQDRQLAMYSIWVKDKFKDAKKVVLKWNMLAFDKEVTSERTDEQLKKLQEEVMNLIKEIEKAEKEDNFPRKQSALCDYCVYKEHHCPSFIHLAKLEKKPIEQFKKDDGVKLVDRYSEIKTKLAELDEEKEDFEIRLIEFSKQLGVDMVYGSNKKCSVKEFDKIVMPEGENKEKFIQLIKDKGLYEELSVICYPKLNSKVIKGDIDKKIKDMVSIVKDWRISISKRKDLYEE